MHRFTFIVAAIVAGAASSFVELRADEPCYWVEPHCECTYFPLTIAGGGGGPIGPITIYSCGGSGSVNVMFWEGSPPSNPGSCPSVPITVTITSENTESVMIEDPHNEGALAETAYLTECAQWGEGVDGACGVDNRGVWGMFGWAIRGLNPTKPGKSAHVRIEWCNGETIDQEIIVEPVPFWIEVHPDKLGPCSPVTAYAKGGGSCDGTYNWQLLNNQGLIKLLKNGARCEVSFAEGVSADQVKGPVRLQCTYGNGGNCSCSTEVEIPVETCSSCQAALGSGTATVGCIDVTLSLGKSFGGESAGHLVYYHDGDDSDNIGPGVHDLQITRVAGVKISTPTATAGQYIQQIKVPDGLAQIVDTDLTTPGFKVEFYRNEDVSDNWDGTYTIVNPAFREWQFLRPVDTSLYQVVDVLGGADNQVYTYSYSGDANAKGWTMATSASRGGPAAQTISRTRNTAGLEVYEVRDEYGNVVFHKETTFDAQGFMTGTSTSSPSGALDTSYTYANGQLQSIVRPDGSWSHYSYGVGGLMLEEISSWKDLPLASSNARVKAYDYTPWLANDAPDDTNEGTLTPYNRPRMITESIEGKVVARTFYGYYTDGGGYRHEIEKRDPSPGGTPNPNGIATTTETIYYPDLWDQTYVPANSGKVYQRVTEDGLVDTYEYNGGYYTSGGPGQAGTFTVSAWEGYTARQILVTHGVVACQEGGPEGIPFKTTREITTYDELGNLRLKQTYTCIAKNPYPDYALVAQTVYDYDSYGHLTRTAELDGTYTEASWGCCRKDWEIDRSGIKTSYLYDALGRVEYSIKEASPSNITTQHIYDGSGRETTQITTATDPVSGLLSRTTSQTRDAAGRLLSQTDESELVTDFSYDTTTEGGRVVKTARPGDVLTDPSEVQEYYRDGRLKHAYGKGVVEKTHDYGVNADGTQWAIVYTGPHSATSPSPRWTRTVTDSLGRTIREEKPAFNDGTNPGDLVTIYEYYTDNDAGHGVGRLKAIKPPLGLAQTIHEYDEVGNVVVTATDVDNNGLNAASGDRIQKTLSEYRLDNGSWWRLVTRLTRPYPSSAVEVKLSEDWTQLTGMSPLCYGVSRHIEFYNDGTNEYPIITTRSSQLERDAKRVSIWTVYHDSSCYGQEIWNNGLLESSTDKAEAQTVYHYDALGRRTGVTAQETGETQTFYVNAGTKPKGVVDYVLDPDGRKTEYFYDTLTGRVNRVENPLGKSQRFGYTSRGEVEHVWGEVPYPIEYEYNAFGEKTKMRTYRGPGTPVDYWTGEQWPTTPAGAQETTWNYDPATGLLVSKTDAANHSVTYSYKPDGRLSTRTWARGAVTTYSYYESGALRTGELQQVDAGPDANAMYTYDRNGRMETATDPTLGTQSYTYKPTGQLESEDLSGLILLTRHYGGASAEAGKPDGLAVTSPGIPDYSVTYSYHMNGPVEQVRGPGLPPMGAYYRYDGPGIMPDGIEYLDANWNILAWTEYVYEHEAQEDPTGRDLIRSIESGCGTAFVSRYTYDYDDLGRRTGVTRTEPAFLPHPGYTGFKDIHEYNDRNELIATNRYDWNPSPAPLGSRLTEYGAFNYDYDHIGNRETSGVDSSQTTYTINNSVNQYDNVSSPPAALTYDADGNLSTDGAFRYTWDGENRLRSIYPLGPSQVGDKALVFWYDYRGRRVMTEHDEYREIYGSYAFLSVKWDFYVYDGWNVIEEIDITGDWELRAQYTWGLDLSHTLQGAGGIGGLLAVHIPAETCAGLSGGGAQTLTLNASNSVVDGALQVATAEPPRKRTPLDLIAARRAALAAEVESETVAGQSVAQSESAAVQSDGGQMQTLTTGADCDYWYLYDANGNVGQLLWYRPAEAVPVGLAAAYEYDPYGNTLVARDVDDSGIAAANKFRFSTKWLHDELTEAGQPGALDTTGLYYYGYRYYSPNLGRWISRDPIGERGGSGLYGFVGNCPISWVDLFGLCASSSCSPEHEFPNPCPADWEKVVDTRRQKDPQSGKTGEQVCVGWWGIWPLCSEQDVYYRATYQYEENPEPMGGQPSGCGSPLHVSITREFFKYVEDSHNWGVEVYIGAGTGNTAGVGMARSTTAVIEQSATPGFEYLGFVYWERVNIDLYTLGDLKVVNGRTTGSLHDVAKEQGYSLAYGTVVCRKCCK